MLHQHFDQFCQHQNPVDIHQMRVFTKKIHSFVKFHTHTFPEEGLLEIFKPVRKIFKHAGIIREAQIHLLNFEKVGIKNEKLEKRLNNLIQKETQNFILKEKKYRVFLLKAEEDFYKELIPISKSHSNRFYRDFFRAPIRIFGKKKYGSHLHDARKNLKSIMHMTELTGKGVNQRKEVHVEYLAELTEKIGNWHDLHQTQLWLKGRKVDANSKNSLNENIEEILLQIASLKEGFAEKIFLVINPNGRADLKP